MKLENIFKEILNEDFKTQTAKFIKQGFEPDIVKSYIDKFKHIRDKKYKEIFDDQLHIDVPSAKRNDIDAYADFHDLERLVDYVGGRRQGVSNFGKSKGEEIEVSGEPVYKDENFEVYYADSPRACITYKGKFPYSWCIARSDSSNMFYTYRFKPYEPAFYFVKNLKLTEKEFGVWNMTKNVFQGKFKYPYHFFVIQVPKNVDIENDESDQYIVSSANNSGDEQMSWKSILKISPKLNTIKGVLKPKPFTPEEREKNERFKNGISDADFAKLSYEDKRSYLDIYPTIARPITYKQFAHLPEDLMNLYVSFGIGLDEEQFNLIKTNKDLMKRYAQISKRKLEEYLSRENHYQRRQLRMAYTELIILPDEDIKKYLESLDQKDINQFINDYGEDKLELLYKHLPDNFSNEHKSIRQLLALAKSGDETALNKITEMLPEEVNFSFYKDHIVFDVSSYGNYLKDHMDDDVYGLLDMVQYNYNFGYDQYYQDDEEVENNYKYYLEEYLKNETSLKQNMLDYGLDWDLDTLESLLKNYNKDEEIRDKIKEEYDDASSIAKEKKWDAVTSEIEKVIYIDRDDDINIGLRALIMFLVKHELFSTDSKIFLDNLVYLGDNILTGYDLPENSYSFYEDLDDNNMMVDTEAIYSEITTDLSDAIDEYANEHDSDDVEGVDADSEDKSIFIKKQQVIQMLKDTLKGLGQDENAKTIQNSIARIDIDRQRFRLDGSVYIKFHNNKTGKEHEGYAKIKNIPNYFVSDTLFEQITLLNRMNRIK